MKLLEEALQALPENFIQLLENYESAEKTFHIIQSHLNDSNDTEKISFLENILILAKGFYYEEGRWIQEKYSINSLLEDKHYDVLEKTFSTLSKGEIEVGLKTNIINGEFPKHIHTRIPGVSQHKTTKQIDVETILNNKGLNKEPLVLSEKLDGSSLYLIYDNTGKLIKGVTRGDGVEGNDITVNIQNISGIKKQIDVFNGLYPANLKEIEIRGETIMIKDSLKTLNEELEKNGEKTYKNTRNVIPGILMSPYNNRGHYLTFKAYQEIYEDVNGTLFERDFIDKFKTLETLGFSTPFYTLIQDKKEIFKIYDEYVLGKRRSLDYDIDGLVIVVNDVIKKNELGYTNKKENGSFAFKFPADAVLSKVKGIRFQLGDSSGNLTPVVEIEPAEIEGVTVTSISLANEALFNSTSLSVGDHVYIRRSGDVIPQIVKNEKFDFFYKIAEDLIHKVVEDIKSNTFMFNTKSQENILSNIQNKLLDEYSETIPLRFELMTDINKLLYTFKNNDSIVGNEPYNMIPNSFVHFFSEDILKSEIKKIANKEEFNPDKNENKRLRQEFMKQVDRSLFDVSNQVKGDYFKIFSDINDVTESNKVLNEPFFKLSKNTIPFITNCPSCNSQLESNGIISKCINKDCEGRKIGEIINFIDKTEIKGVKKSSIEFLFQNNLVKSIEDLFKLEKKDFVISVDPKGNEVYFKGWGERKIDNTLETIQELKKLESHVFLGSLGIQQYGRSSFEKLLEVCSFQDIIDNKLTVEDYQKVDGFQNVDNLIASLEEKKELIGSLLKYIEVKQPEKVELAADVIKIYFTGSPKGIAINGVDIQNKEQLFSILSDISDGKIIQTEKFSKSVCDILLYGGDATTKIEKANKMGIKTVSMEDLLKEIDVTDKIKLLDYLNKKSDNGVSKKNNSDINL